MSRQAIAIGTNGPIFVNETGTRQAITAPGLFLNETSGAGPTPPGEGANIFRSPIKNLGGMMSGSMR